ncbi:MAG TPA: radical SAM protein [Vicinamibacterales bacterium]|nr:radical SAM protein [Acidobacteriota bacterium]HOC18459.1 radical SAM protein [Vicinamibacterales bacterium]
MLFRGLVNGIPVTGSLKENSLSLAEDERLVVSWDLGGRLYSVWRFKHTWRRGLNGEVLYKWYEEGAGGPASRGYDERRRRTLTREEAAPVVDEAARFASRALAAMQEMPGSWSGRENPGVWSLFLQRLEACARFNSGVADADAARFAELYRPVGILPPDQYLSVVLQATEGCSFGSCTFCDLYHDGYRVKAPGEFAAHVRGVVEYLGASIALRRRSIFLGAANALAVPVPRLVALLETLRATFPAPLPPVRAFVDAFTGVRKNTEDYRVLAGLGLGRVYIGLESGHDPLLAFVRKPGTAGEAVETVRAMKAAGLQVGVIVMIGLGGEAFSSPHVEDTARTVNAMGLGEGDLLYFSDLVEMPGTAYPAIARDAQVRPLDLAARLAQLSALRSRLAFTGRPPQYARYDIREFVY